MKRYLYKNIDITPIYNKTYVIRYKTENRCFILGVTQADNMKQAYKIGKQEVDNLNKYEY